MKSNHLLLLALKKVREHVGEGTNTFRFLTSELGLLRSIQGIADVIHFIPMEGQAESLNAAVAAGIVMFECLRQRLAGKGKL